MRQWLLGVLAFAAVCASAPALDAFQATQAGQPPVPSLLPEFQPKPYPFGPGDTIRLEFYNLSDSDADMKKVYLVEAAGTIQLKYVGSIQVNRLTSAQIEDAVEKALVDNMLYPAGVVQFLGKGQLGSARPIGPEGQQPAVFPGEAEQDREHAGGQFDRDLVDPVELLADWQAIKHCGGTHPHFG